MTTFYVRYLLYIMLLLSFISEGSAKKKRGGNDNKVARDKFCSFALISLDKDNELTDSSGISIFTIKTPLPLVPKLERKRVGPNKGAKYLYLKTDTTLTFEELQKSDSSDPPKYIAMEATSSTNSEFVYKLYNSETQGEVIGVFKSGFQPCAKLWSTVNDEVYGLFVNDEDGNTLRGVVVPTFGNKYKKIFNEVSTRVTITPCLYLNQNDFISPSYNVPNDGLFCFRRKRPYNYKCAGIIRKVSHMSFGTYENIDGVRLKVTDTHRFYYNLENKLTNNDDTDNIEIRRAETTVSFENNRITPNFTGDYYKIYHNDEYTNYYMSNHPCAVWHGRYIPIYDESTHPPAETSTNSQRLGLTDDDFSNLAVGYFRRKRDIAAEDEEDDMRVFEEYDHYFTRADDVVDDVAGI